MKPRCSNQRNVALTLTEVLVVVALLTIGGAMSFQVLRALGRSAKQVKCVDQLRQVGSAFANWERDHGGNYPMQVSVMTGGTMELVATGNVAATFQIVSNELINPKVLICPAEKNRFCATNFSTGFSAKNISYFVSLDANTNFPQSFLSGDNNLAISGEPVKSGLIELRTNVPTSWTSARHFKKGNISLTGGSAWQAGFLGLSNLLHQTGLATNRIAIP